MRILRGGIHIIDYNAKNLSSLALELKNPCHLSRAVPILLVSVLSTFLWYRYRQNFADTPILLFLLLINYYRYFKVIYIIFSKYQYKET